MKRVAAVEARLRLSNGAEPTLNELSICANVEPDVARRALGWLYDRVLSLSQPLGEDGGTLLDLIEDRWVGSPRDAIADTKLRDRVAEVLKTLRPREELIIRLRFGIGCEREHTLEEVGAELHIRASRVWQIELRAMTKLKGPKKFAGSFAEEM